MFRITLHDSQSRAIRDFQPVDETSITMWCCGPTVYDVPHIGNARPAVVFDLLFRLLRLRYGETSVRYARNLTDIDDKIIDRAQDLGMSIEALTAQTAGQYLDLTTALNVLPPTLTPRATEAIGPIVAMIETLMERGHAYAADGHVLFNVASHGLHGSLSGMPMDQLREGARVEIAPYKRDPADFVLWKPSDASQPGWTSPWGRGRPGWHIECSAMIERDLGRTIDIHAGGADLLFPHHENEAAQSFCAHGVPLARHWVHNGMLLVDGAKMSKSAGNFITFPAVLERYHPEVLRYLFLTTHYRQPLDFTWKRLETCKATLDGLYRAKAEIPLHDGADISATAVCRALADDLHTPNALAVLHAALSSHSIAAADELVATRQLLGVLRLDPTVWFQGGDDTHEIERIIADRALARSNRDWAQSDLIREQLHARGVLVEDGPEGTTWRRS